MFDFGKRNSMTMNLDNENRLVIAPAKEHSALPDVNLPGSDQAALQHTPTGGIAANES